MSLKAIIFFGCVLSFLTFNELSAKQTSTDQSLAWYQAFFESKNEKNVDQKLKHASSKLEEAVETRDGASQSRWLKEAGLINLASAYDYSKAMDLFIQALSLEDSIGLKQERIFTHIAIAQVFEAVGELQKASESLEEALSLNEQFKDPEVLVFILNKLGKINAALGRLDHAFDNYELVLKYKDEVDDPALEGEALFNLAHLYTLQAKYNDALETHKKALAIRRALGDRRTEAQSLNEIGELYRLMKNNEKALANHVVALEISQAIGDKQLIAISFNNIGQLYFFQNNFQRAIANLELALNEGRDAQAHEEIKRSYDYLSQCYQAIGDYKKAFEYKELFVAMNEFIQNEKNEQRISETQNRYVIDKKQSQIESLDLIRIQKEKELVAQMQFRNFLIAILILGVIVILLVLYLYILKQRSNRNLKIAHAKVQEQNIQLHDLNATKDKFFSIISHDLKGPLNSLTSFSGLLINHTDSLSKDEIKMLAGDLDKSLKNLFALLENLLEWSRSQTGNIEFKPEQFDITSLLEQNKSLLQTQAANKKITIDNQVKIPLQVNAHRHSINTVTRNLISNAIKFTPEGGIIQLRAEQSDGNVRVSIKDNGVGMPPEVMGKLFRIDTKHTTKGTANEKGTGLGLILCKDFIEKNGGQIGVESEVGKGSTFYFTIPAVESAIKAEVTLS